MSNQGYEEIRLVTWNINGWRSATRKGLPKWAESERPDIWCIQELRLSVQQVVDLNPAVPGYTAYFLGSNHPGYSGTAILSRVPFDRVGATGMTELDIEGRTLVAEFAHFIVINAYVPNGNRSNTRLEFKHRYLAALRQYVEALSRNGKCVFICGDFNTAHTHLDLAQPPTRVKHRSGFLPSERVLMDNFTQDGWQDAFRVLHPDENASFTWWAAHASAYERNMGWRFDYIFVPDEMAGDLCEARMSSQVRVSDHCPFSISFRSTHRG